MEIHMFNARKSAKFIRGALTVAVTALTLGALPSPQGSAQAASYNLTTCNPNELINAWNAAIASTVDDAIYLKGDCTYTFTTAFAGDGALADLPATSTAGTIYMYGNGATITKFGSAAISFLETLQGSALWIYNVTFTNFSGSYGGVLRINGAISVFYSTFHSNISSQIGGAMFGGGDSSVLVYGSNFYLNQSSSSGAIATYGTLRIGSSSIHSNYATAGSGGIGLASGAGGGIYFGSGSVGTPPTAFLYDTTLYGNRANTTGGGIFMQASVAHEFRTLTIANNACDDDQDGTGDGGGIFGSGVKLFNSVIAKNLDKSPSGTVHPDASSSFDPVGKNNFVGIGTGVSGITDNTNGNRVGTSGTPLDPLLGTLQTRPGLYPDFPFVPPLPNSPLINSGANQENLSGVDGRLYRRNLYGTVDIGAVEFKRPDSPVIVNPANQGWLHRNTNSAGPVELSYLYGQGLSDYQPVAGDWNGDGVSTQGIYTRFNANNIGVFALSNTFNSFDAATFPAFVYTDANSAWLPVAGDWDSDSIDTVGVYRTTDGVWALTNLNGSITPIYPAFVFGGGAGVLPLSGDWDGDGDDSIGVYSFASNRFILSNGITSSAAVDYNFVYGAAGSYPVVGDWNGDGVDTPGLYNPVTGQWLLRNTNDTGSANIAFVYGAGGSGSNLIGRAGQWKTVTPGNGANPIRELAVTPDAPQIAPTFAP